MSADIVIVGAGFGGIALARELRRAGIEDFVVLARGDDLIEAEGADRCSHCGREIAPRFRASLGTRLFARGEVREDLRRTVERDGLRPHIRVGSAVAALEFDEATDRWDVRTAAGLQWRPRLLVSAVGPLHDPARFARQPITGRGGRTLAEAWSAGPEAFLGTTVHGFPNLFLVAGPNSLGGHRRTGAVLEAQAGYVRRCMQLMRRAAADRIEVRAATQHEFNRRLRARAAAAASGGSGAYRDSDGVDRVAWPGSSASYRRAVRRPDPRHFDLTVSAEREAAHEYSGPARLDAPGAELPVTVTLNGHPDPIDGRYHWYGRVSAANPADLPDPGRGHVRLTLPGGVPVDATLQERDPWGNLRIAGVGAPPFPLESAPIR
ncbi:DUF4873 domain-containing protein [Nocardia wallacei]|uniref:DUF4873 domain-containing protein n=1 Tax=Nocardia wallacei TaxID=480035 RepID=A0A7G1KJL2_9NOCA|nr:DUF4873 domain-containing protein [Nocardia wallacei]BCK55437.1 hypothetical protein NWFMUON74_32090 [Nocardia wallacei]